MSFQDIVKRILEKVMPIGDEEVAKDYDAFLSLAEKYSSIQEYLATFVTDKEQFSQFYEADYQECPYEVGNDFLTLSTIHSAKGLEWESVFIVGLCEGNFPNDYFCQNLPPEEKEEFFNNEWKKMYVAATRAKEHLLLTYSSTISRKGFTFPKTPSRFVANVPV